MEIIEQANIFLLCKSEMDLKKLFFPPNFDNNYSCSSSVPFLCLKKDMGGEQKRLGIAGGRKLLENLSVILYA